MDMSLLIWQFVKLYNTSSLFWQFVQRWTCCHLHSSFWSLQRNLFQHLKKVKLNLLWYESVADWMVPIGLGLHFGYGSFLGSVINAACCCCCCCVLTAATAAVVDAWLMATLCASVSCFLKWSASCLARLKASSSSFWVILSDVNSSFCDDNWNGKQLGFLLIQIHWGGESVELALYMAALICSQLCAANIWKKGSSTPFGYGKNLNF